MKTFIYLLTTLWWLGMISVHAADLKFEPATPIVEINKPITLSVVNSKGTAKWVAVKGSVQGDGNNVTYVAPDQAGLDVITVLDSKENFAILKVAITLPNNFSSENAQWKMFTNRSQINALLLSDDGKTLWVGTNGGLEQWDTEKGAIQKILTRLEGLPSNKIVSLVSDNYGGLWFATEEKDIVHIDKQDKQQIYSGKSKLPYKKISKIINDGTNGIWFNNYELVCVDDPRYCNDYREDSALIHLNYNGEWTVYTRENSKLSGNIGTLFHDNQGGVWLTVYQDWNTSEGYSLIHIDSSGQWSAYPANYTEYNNLYNQYQQNAPWIDDSELIHLSRQENAATFSRSEIGLLSNSFSKFISDQKNGVWILGSNSVLHMSSENSQEIFHEDSIDVEHSLSDDEGGIWVKSEVGMVHFNNKLERNFYKIEDDIESIVLDEIGGIWVQTTTSIVYINNKMERQDYDIQEKLTDKSISSIRSDDNGLWIRMSDSSFAYLTRQGEWIAYPSYDELLANNVVVFEPLKCSDGQGGWWYDVKVTTNYGENDHNVITISHKNSSGKVSDHPYILDINSSYIPSIDSEYCDGYGGMWIVTDETSDIGFGSERNRIVRLNSQGQWKTYDELGQNLQQIFADKEGNLWVSMSEHIREGVSDSYLGKGLAFLSNQGQVKIYTKENSELPDNYITKLFGDPHGGVWVVTKEDSGNNAGFDWGGAGKGLVHLSSSGKLTVYTSDKTYLPSNQITSILPDERGGLWIGSNDVGELAHLTFGRNSELCTQSQIDATACQAIQQGKHAAIIVAAGGSQQTNTLWESTESITTNIYKMFYQRGFNKSNIYYLSSKTWADFDGDGFNDRINRISEDRHLRLNDLKKSFEWAKGLGKLDQPLYFFFMDHGGEGKLHLAPNLQISAEDIKPLLDDYQATTGNQLIVVLEACHSGSLIPALTAPNRAIITSAKADEKAYFFEKKGFSRFFADYLTKGSNFSEAFQLATRDQDKLRGKNLQFQTAGGAGMTPQTPQLDDNNDGKYDPTQDNNWLKTVYINGKFTTADDTLAIENLTPVIALAVGQPVQLQAKATVAQGTVKRVWAVIRPPKMAQVLDTNGTPILAFPRVNLVQATESPNTWQTTWNDATYNGTYTITFYAEDNEKNIASSDQDAILTVNGGIEPPAQAQVEIQLDKTRYQRGEQFKAALTENLGWGYDLYTAVVMPDGNYFTLKNTNELRGVKEAKPWYMSRKQGQPITLLDLPLPTSLPTGQYCLYGILSPEQNDVFEAMNKNLWVYGQQCFEVF